MPAITTVSYGQRSECAVLAVVTTHGQVVFSCPADTSSGKRFPRIAFAGDLETLSSQESALGAKIRMSERSEFGFLPLFLADFCKLRVSGSETRNPEEPFSRAYPSEQLSHDNNLILI